MQKQRLIIVGARAQHGLSRDVENYETRVARTCSEARLLLADSPAPSYILTDISLPDGNWCDVLRLAVHLEVPADVQVLGRDCTPSFQLEVAARGGRCVPSFELRPTATRGAA